MSVKNELLKMIDERYQKFSKGQKKLADFIKEIGLPTTLREVGVEKKEDLKEIADSCYLVDGSYKKMTHEEILEIFLECF